MRPLIKPYTQGTCSIQCASLLSLSFFPLFSPQVDRCRQSSKFAHCNNSRSFHLTYLPIISTSNKDFQSSRSYLFQNNQLFPLLLLAPGGHLDTHDSWDESDYTSTRIFTFVQHLPFSFLLFSLLEPPIRIHIEISFKSESFHSYLFDFMEISFRFQNLRVNLSPLSLSSLSYSPQLTKFWKGVQFRSNLDHFYDTENESFMGLCH